MIWERVTLVTEVTRKRFTVGEYHRMVQAGILHEYDRVELIDGEIVEMTPIGHRHWLCVNLGTVLFTEALGRRALVSIQNSAPLNNWSEPQPDIAIYKSREDFYAGKLPGPEDVLLIVEVADSSLNYDRKVKVPLYAKSGIPEVWIENLSNDTILVYRDPIAGSYSTLLTLTRSDSISPLGFPDVSFRADDLLGKPITAKPS